MRVIIIYMPFGVVEYPHLGTGLLKSCLEREGYPCEIRNYALDFARFIGRDMYSFIEGGASPILLGERIFARQLSRNIPDMTEFYRDIVRPAVRGLDNAIVYNRSVFMRHVELMREVEKKAAEWLMSTAGRDDFAEYDIIGFSTSYEQNTASLALAKILRRNWPGKPVIFGGSNCMGEMGLGLLRAFEFIDYVFTGESERTLVQFLKWMESPSTHPFPDKGVISRPVLESGNYNPDTDMIQDLDALPPPNYDDYFRELRKEKGWEKHFFAIALEGSRGCWKAHRRHCLFCGLNGAQNRYRCKGSARFIRELEHLCKKYDVKYVMMNDNILSASLMTRAFPKLTNSRPYKVMWQQIKVGLTKSQLELLCTAGVTYVSAGLESLSTRLLEIIRKGLPGKKATAIENIHLLRMLTELGIDLTWHIICGLPGEQAEDYTRMAGLMRNLHHLPPPKQLVQISLDRHSPLYEEAESFGFELEPSKAYRYVYDVPPDRLAGFSYFFQDRKTHGDQMYCIGPPSYTMPVKTEITAWKDRWRESLLGVVMQDHMISVHDQRDARDAEDTYTGVAKAVIESVMEPCPRQILMKQVCDLCGLTSEAAVHEALNELLGKGYVVEESGIYLFLGVDYETTRRCLSRNTDNFFLRALRENRPYAYDH